MHDPLILEGQQLSLVDGRGIEKIKLLMVLKITISVKVFLITFEKFYIKFN
jgi:hypothetical protein